MVKTLQEYVEWLDEREIIWPAPPKPVSAKATPHLKRLRQIRAVTWSVYGTLLRISEGELLFDHPQRMRMQVALDKTIHEYNIWRSMHRKPGAPWKQLYSQYKRIVADRRMAPTQQKGDVPEVDSSSIWRKLLARLGEKEYEYDMSFYGTPEELSDKMAYFFHANLQGVEAAPNVLGALTVVSRSRLKQGLLADAQPFTLVQMLRALKKQGTLPPLSELFDLECSTLSFQEGVRKPSKSLYRRCLQQLDNLGIAPHEVLHVGSRLADDLAVAKQFGMRTALYAADKVSLRATHRELKDPELKPDRLLTELGQIRDILGIG